VGDFVHLHTHTEYSMLDGASRIGDVVTAAVADGQPAIGITDHGNMYGVLDFYRAARAAGIVPVIGFEAYMAAESRFERPVRRGRVDAETGGDGAPGDKLYYHLTLLAETDAGYKNLIKLSSAAYLEGYFYKPRVDWELLDRHSEGVIATSGCLGGVVCQALLRGEPDVATKLAGRLQDIFGPDRFYIELQDHGIDGQRQSNPQLVDIARHLGAPLLATNDSHYTHRADAVSHDVLLCVQTGSSIDDPKRFRFEGDQHYLKSAAEMRSLFAELPEACDNTLAIAERCHVTIEFGKPELPRFALPAGVESEDAYLRQLTYEGARRRYGDPVPAEVVERIEHELEVIAGMGFSAYFLIVGDLIGHARASGIRVGPGRGSSAGCCVAYCLRIVDIDPVANGLLFERFLNAGRKEMPDIDMDFDERYRGEMIRYAAERYGADHVAQVVTFSTIKARAAVRDAARALGYPYGVGDRIAKAMPPLVMGRDTPLRACLEKQDGHEDGYKTAAELRTIYETDPDARKVMDVALGLENLRRQDGIHAAAVVITREPLTEYLPVQRKPEPGGDPADAPIVTQYEMHGVAELGLLKMDFLGLRNLTVIERALDLIEASTGSRPDVDNLPLDDEKTYEMLRRGDSIGVFQLEGGPMRTLMRSLAPTCFDDVAALVALYRPGPMAANMHNAYADRKNGRQPVTCLHDDLAELLADTHGLLIYQEGLMLVAQKFAGYSLQDADNLRKACGKKVRSLMALEREKFVEGCERTGYGRALGERLFAMIEPFADYAFNKSHAYCYGMVAYQTAWLKANHPVEYFAGLLTSVKDDKDKTAVYLSECRAMGIEVLVPDVNESVSDFGAADMKIRFGLSAVRNVGEGLVAHIVAERDANGPFADFYDFCRRVDPLVLNKRSIESLVKAGAFDSLGHRRLGLLNAFERIIDLTLARRREQELGVMSLFGDAGGSEPAVHDDRVPIGDVEFDSHRRLAFEKEMLGLYVSGHPLLGVEGLLRRYADCTIADLQELRDGEIRCVGGVVTALQRKFTRRGEPMAVFTLEDLRSSVEVMVFPRTMQECGALLADDAVVCVKGRVDLRDPPPKLVCMQLSRPDVASGEPCAPVRIKLSPNAMSGSLLGRLKRLLRDHPGESQVFVHLDRLRHPSQASGGSSAGEGAESGAPAVTDAASREGIILRLPDEFRVDSRNGLFAELRVLLGPNGLVT
jgi:DNA polymerase-3 subunit alpha